MRNGIRAAFVAIAVAFLAWEGYGAFRWVADAGGLAPAARRFWALLHDDWMLLIVVTDHLLLAGIALVVLWVDANRSAWPLGRRVLLALAFVALGSPLILGYLAWRLGEGSGNRHDRLRGERG